MAKRHLNNQINIINQKKYNDYYQLAEDLARLLLDMNIFHPFREGNGRSQRMFIMMLSKQKGIYINLSKKSSKYVDYMSACKNDDWDKMTKILFESFDSI
ncbi:Fic family protein [Companilactobacillus furfuricola]|uniref:Fic family protein n=1 Tax=Companilactobacillus furfuricola TaxID=1462575 RepID=UPI000F79FE51|nr:Fic family protein [Companilactobacillus furfuricola]